MKDSIIKQINSNIARLTELKKMPLDFKVLNSWFLEPQKDEYDNCISQLIYCYKKLLELGVEPENPEIAKIARALAHKSILLADKDVWEYNSVLKQVMRAGYPLLKQCLSLFKPEELCENPALGQRILEFCFENRAPVEEIKTWFSDAKLAAPILNNVLHIILERRGGRVVYQTSSSAEEIKTWFSDAKLAEPILNEILQMEHRGGGEVHQISSSYVRFMLDNGIEVTADVIKAVSPGNRYWAIPMLLEHLKRLPNWYQTLEDGYDLLYRIIEVNSPKRIIKDFLQKESKREQETKSSLLTFVSPDGSQSFSQFLSAASDRDDFGQLAPILSQYGAIITGEALTKLKSFGKTQEAFNLLAQCRSEDLFKRHPQHGSDLIAAVIRCYPDKAIEQITPWLEAKDDKAVAAILSTDLGNGPLVAVCELLENERRKGRGIVKALNEFSRLFFSKGVIPLKLDSCSKEEMFRLVMIILNLEVPVEELEKFLNSDKLSLIDFSREIIIKLEKNPRYALEFFLFLLKRRYFNTPPQTYIDLLWQVHVKNQNMEISEYVAANMVAIVSICNKDLEMDVGLRPSIIFLIKYFIGMGSSLLSQTLSKFPFPSGFFGSTENSLLMDFDFIQLERVQTSLSASASINFLVRTYFDGVKELTVQSLKESSFLLPELCNLVCEYVQPLNLIDSLLHAIKRQSNDSVRSLEVPQQPNELGFCSGYAAFNALLPAALLNMDLSLLEIFYKEANSHPRHAMINALRGGEAVTPVRVMDLFTESKLVSSSFPAFPDLLQTLTRFNQAGPVTMVPFVTNDEKNTVKIDHSDNGLQLAMLKNMLLLQARYSQGFPIAHPILIHVNQHWFTLVWIGQKSKGHLWMSLNSAEISSTAMIEPMSRQLQQCMTDENDSLKELGKTILEEALPEVSISLNKIISADTLLSHIKLIHALLEVYEVVLRGDTIKPTGWNAEKHKAILRGIATQFEKYPIAAEAATPIYMASIQLIKSVSQLFPEASVAVTIAKVGVLASPGSQQSSSSSAISLRL